MSRCADLLFETLAVFDVRIRHCDNMTENKFKKKYFWTFVQKIYANSNVQTL